MPELWYCMACWNKGPLDTHGRCERCQSEAVVSIEATFTRMPQERATLAQERLERVG